MLLTLPVELVHDIIDQIDTPRDLAALSAVCQGLKQIISPTSGTDFGPLQCWHLSVSVGNGPVWRSLASKPRLARAVRSLRIFSGPTTVSEDSRAYRSLSWIDHVFRIPDHYSAAFVSEIRAALAHMQNLEFLCCHPLPILRSLDWSNLFGKLTESCPKLRDVYLDLRGEPDTQVQDVSSLPSLDGLGALTAFHLSHESRGVSTANAIQSYHISALVKLVVTSPALRYLSLTCATGTVEKLSQYDFPTLQALSLSLDRHADVGFAERESSAPLRDFLERHPTILALKLLQISPARLSVDCLPLLQELYFPGIRGNILRLVLPLSSGQYRPLRWLDVSRPYHLRFAGGEDDRWLLELDGVQGICIDGDNVDWLGRSPPALQTISCQCPSWYHKKEKAQRQFLTRLVDSFPTIRYIKNFFPPSTASETISCVLRGLDESCSRLVCVDHWLRNHAGDWEFSPKRSRELHWQMIDVRLDGPVETDGWPDPVL